MSNFDELNRKTGLNHLLMESPKGLDVAVGAKIAGNQLLVQAAEACSISGKIKDLAKVSGATEMYRNIDIAEMKAKVLDSCKAAGMDMTEDAVKGSVAAYNRCFSGISAMDAMKSSPVTLTIPNIPRLTPRIPHLYDSLTREKDTALLLTSREYKDFLLMLEEEHWVSPKYYELFYNSNKIRRRRLVSAICKKKIKFQVRTDNENIIEDWPQEIDDDSRELVDSYLSNNSSNFLLLEGESFLSWLKENYPPDGEKSFPQEGEANSDSSPIANQALSLPLKHECEPAWLKVALECWKALYENKTAEEGKRINKKAIEKWLQENHAELSVNSRKTIVTVVNPFKNGGATPSL